MSAERRACSSAVWILDCRLVDGGRERLHLRGFLAGGLQQAVTILDGLVIVVDQRNRGPVGQTDVGGDDVVLVLGVVDIVAQVVKHLHLGVGLRQAGGELVGHLDRLRGVGERGDAAGALDALNLAVAETQAPR